VHVLGRVDDRVGRRGGGHPADRPRSPRWSPRAASTTDIAQEMFLSRRTVQTYISRILTKLDARSRVEIVREAVRQGVPL
jgi:hypothetical protein